MPNMPNTATPAKAKTPSEPPPTLCDVFHIDILKLRSRCENQCAMIRPHGGHPMPEIQPAASMKPNSRALLRPIDCPSGSRPTDIITSDANISPTTRNLRASERSDRLPMMNLLKAYATGIPVMAKLTPALSSRPSSIIDGAANDRFLRTR